MAAAARAGSIARGWYYEFGAMLALPGVHLEAQCILGMARSR